MSCSTPSYATRLERPSGCGCAGSSREHAVADRVRKALAGMPGIAEVDAFKSQFSKYVIVLTDGAANWRSRQVPGLVINRQSGIPGAIGMIDTATGVHVYFQPRQGFVDISNAQYDAPMQAWVDKAKADPAYADAVQILRTATSVDYRYEGAEAVINGDALFGAVYSVDDNRRTAPRPPKKGSDFHACGGFQAGGRRFG